MTNGSGDLSRGDTPLRSAYGNKEMAQALGARYRAGAWYAPADRPAHRVPAAGLATATACPRLGLVAEPGGPRWSAAAAGSDKGAGRPTVPALSDPHPANPALTGAQGT